MKYDELTDKILKGGQLAIKRLIERKQKEDGFIVVSQQGKIVKLRARDIKLTEDS